MILIRNIALILLAACMLSSCIMRPEVLLSRLNIDGMELRSDTNGKYQRICMPAQSAFIIEPTNHFLMQKPPGYNYRVGPVSFVVLEIKDRLELGTKKVFEAFANNTGFKGIVNAAIALVIVFYGTSIMLGITPIRGMHALKKLLRIVAVSVLALNYTDFAEIVSKFFEDSSDGLIIAMNGIYTGDQYVAQGNEEIIFGDVDALFGFFFSNKFIASMIALASTGFSGLFYVLLLFIVVIIYVFAVTSAVYIYVVALIARGMLFALAPPFLITLLFRQTRELFNSWLRQVINYSLQPVFLFAFLGLFHVIIFSFLGAMASGNNLELCYMRLIKFYGTGYSLYWPFYSEDGGLTRSFSEPNLDMIVVCFVLIFLTLTMIMFNSWAIEMASVISGGLTALMGADRTMIGQAGMKSLGANILGKPAGAAAGGARGFLLGTMGAGGNRGEGGLIRGKPVRGAAGGAQRGWDAAHKTARAQDKNIIRRALGLPEKK